MRRRRSTTLALALGLDLLQHAPAELLPMARHLLLERRPTLAVASRAAGVAETGARGRLAAALAATTFVVLRRAHELRALSLRARAAGRRPELK